MPGPLDGIRVFDLTHAAAGPWGVMLLASLGADVIKVESPGGDLIRLVPPAQKGLGVVYTHSNLGKRSIVLDLKTPHHQSIAHKLVEKADVLMENMRPGAAERLGLGYEQVSRINPRIIYGSSTAWGNVGPMARMGGADSSVQAFCGWTSVSGAPGGKGEVFRHIAHLDLTTSSMFVASILQALLVREKTGKGMRMDLTMVGSAMNLQLSRIAEYFATGETPPTLGSGCVATVPHQAFMCQDKNWLAVGVVKDEQWPAFCRAIGREDLLDDRRLSTNPGRVEHRDEMVPILEGVFLAKPRSWWEIQLTKEGVPNGPFLDFGALRYHAQVRENRYMVPIDIPHQGRMLFGGLPWKFGKTPASLRPAPSPGQHTLEVVDELGMSLEEPTMSPEPVGDD